MIQFPSQIRGSKALSLLEALPNQLLFPNSEAASADYDGFRLTDDELDFVLSPFPGRRMVLSRTPGSSTVLNVDPKALGSLLTPLGGGQAALNAFRADYDARPNSGRSDSAIEVIILHNFAYQNRICRRKVKMSHLAELECHPLHVASLARWRVQMGCSIS